MQANMTSTRAPFDDSEVCEFSDFDCFNEFRERAIFYVSLTFIAVIACVCHKIFTCISNRIPSEPAREVGVERGAMPAELEAGERSIIGEDPPPPFSPPEAQLQAHAWASDVEHPIPPPAYSPPPPEVESWGGNTEEPEGMPSAFSLPCEEEAWAAAVATDNAEGTPSAFSSPSPQRASVYNIARIQHMACRVEFDEFVE